MQSYPVLPSDTGTLIDFLAKKLELSKKGAKRLLDSKRVFVNGRRIWMAQSKLMRGDKVEVQGERARAELQSSQTLYQDNEYLIFDKPPGIVTNGPDSLELKLRELFNLPGLTAVHRLDKDTSGCVLMAKSRAIKEKTEIVFRQKQVQKIYNVIVAGWVSGDIDEVKKPIDGKAAITKIEIISANDFASHLRLKIPTGRTHQIRKHMLSIRHPVVGDKDYNNNVQSHGLFKSINRQMLHASELSFASPFNGKEIAIKSRLPKDFVLCLKGLELI